MKQKKVIVIGAGYGGLSTAALLAKNGFKVTVLERHDQAGGRARMIKEKGFSFDMGPSWYLMPDIFERFFNQFGKKPEDYYKLIRLNPAYKIIYKDDNSKMTVPPELQDVYKLFDSLEENGAEKIKEYLKISEYQYRVSVDEFLYKNYTSIFDFFNKRLMIEGTKLKVFQSVEKFVAKRFSSKEAQNLLKYNMVFLGADPKKAPAIYALMTYVDFVLGVWYPEGGLNAVARGIEQCAKEQGVEFVYNAEVEAINTQNGKATSVTVNGENIEADIVISNADYHHTETKLLKEKDQTFPESYWQKRTMAPSGFMMYLGANKKIKNLEHHTLVLYKDLRKHFDAVFDNPSWPEHPSYYVCAPSKTDATVAPEGKENMFILVPVASELNDSDKIREQYEQKILEDLEKVTGEDIQGSLEVKKVYTQRNFAKDYHAYKGTALGLSHTLFQTAFFRPGQQSKKVENLHYVGQYTHPGIGVPMTLISAEVLLNEMKKKYAEGNI